jgi:hypothetical protein
VVANLSGAAGGGGGCWSGSGCWSGGGQPRAVTSNAKTKTSEAILGKIPFTENLLLSLRLFNFILPFISGIFEAFHLQIFVVA